MGFAGAFGGPAPTASLSPGETHRRRSGETLWTLLMPHLWIDTQDPPLDWRIR